MNQDEPANDKDGLSRPNEASYFALFDLPERLDLDRADLEARYHALAREHHPDRFAARAAAAQAAAAERMELVNRAYRTLRDPWERVRYVLAQHGVVLSQAQVPVQLAEEYFELQEGLEALRGAGQREEAIARLTDLRTTLAGLARDWEGQVDVLAREHDALDAPERQGIRERLARLVGDLSYLRAMRRDLDAQLMAAGV